MDKSADEFLDELVEEIKMAPELYYQIQQFQEKVEFLSEENHRLNEVDGKNQELQADIAELKSKVYLAWAYYENDEYYNMVTTFKRIVETP